MMKLRIFPPVPIATSREDRLHGIGFMVLAALFWALVEMTGRFIPSNYTAFQTVWVRYAVHLAFMLAVFGPTQRTNLVRTNLLKLQLIRPLLMIGMPLFYILGVRVMPGNNVWSVFWLSPLMVIGMGFLLLGERVNISHWLAGTVGLVGALLIYHPGLGALSWRIVLPLGMAFCFSFYRIMTRVLYAERTVANLFYTAFIVFIPWSLGLPFFWRDLTLQALMPMVAIGLLGYLTLFFLDKAYERAPASVLAPFIYIQPLFLVVLSFLSFGRFPDHSTALGSLVILGSGLYLVLHEAHLSPQWVLQSIQHRRFLR